MALKAGEDLARIHARDLAMMASLTLVRASLSGFPDAARNEDLPRRKVQIKARGVHILRCCVTELRTGIRLVRPSCRKRIVHLGGCETWNRQSVLGPQHNGD
jgi:hypothetical protein